MYLGVTAALAALSVATVQGDFTAQQHAGVIESLRSAFHAECIFLLAAPGDAPMQLLDALKDTRKSLSDALVGVGARPGARGEPFRCRRNRPLNVFLSEGEALEALGAHARPVPSYPRWLVFKADSAATLKDLFSSLYIPFDCEFLVAELEGSGVRLSDVYKTHKDGVLHSGHFGVWGPGEGATIPRPHLYDRRRSLHGLVLRGVSMDNRPSASVTKLENGSLIYGGYYGKIWSLLEQQLNFTTDRLRGENGLFRSGSRLDNGSWTGMIGMLQQGRADVGVTGFQLSARRLEAVDFLIPIARISINLLMREPDMAIVEWSDFLDPFSPGLWSAILLSIALLGVALSGVRSVGRRHGSDESESMDDTDPVADSLLQVAGLFCQQGQDEPPRALSSRLVFLLAGLTSIVYLAAYSAELISFLTNQKLQLPFNSIEEFAGDRSYQIGLKWTNFQLIENSSEPGMRRLYEEYFLPHDNFRRVVNESPQNLVCTDKFAYLAGRPINLEPLDCSVFWFPGNLMTMSKSFVVAKGSPYRQILNKKLRIVKNSGVLARIFTHTWPQQESAMTFKSALTQVTFSQVVPMLAVVAAGIVLSALVLGVEAAVGALRRLRGGATQDHWAMATTE